MLLQISQLLNVWKSSLVCIQYVRVKAPPRVYRKYSTRGCVERLIQHEAKPSAVFASRHPRVLYFSYTQARRCFKCYIVLPGHVWLGEIFSSTQTAAIFGDKDISKCLTNLFLVVERTNMISLASFRDLQCYARDQLCCLSGVMFKSFMIR